MRLSVIDDNRDHATNEKGPLWRAGRLFVYLKGDSSNLKGDDCEHFASFSWHFGRDACVGASISVKSGEGCPLIGHFGVPYASFHAGIGSSGYQKWPARLARWWNRQSWGLDRENPVFSSPAYPGLTFCRVETREYGVRIFAWALWFRVHSDPMDERYGKTVTIHALPRDWSWLRRLLTRSFDLTALREETPLKLGDERNESGVGEVWLPVFKRRVEVPLPEGPIMGTFRRIRHSERYIPAEWVGTDPESIWWRRLKPDTFRRPGALRRLAMKACDFVFASPSWVSWTADFDEPGLRHPGKAENSWDIDDDATSSMSFGCDTIFLHDAVGQAVASCLRDRYKNDGLAWRPADVAAGTAGEENPT